MGSVHLPTLTATLLKAYSGAALRNADDLCTEASLLLDHGHMARAYFLAVACIEEAGKALITFDAQCRNLSDPGICSRLKKSTESHGEKINYALCMWALNSSDQRKALNVAIGLVIDAKNGREPAMYSDLSTEPDHVRTPREVVRDGAARDCVRLAKACLEYAHDHVTEKTPSLFTTAQDRIYTMKPTKFQEILNNEDFWWYFIARLEVGRNDIAEAVLGYEKDHQRTGVQFRATQ